MSTKPDGGQAFPQPVAYTPMGQEVPSYPGMTLRDYFAAKALQGLLASPNATQEWIKQYGASSAYGIADLMLVERDKS